MIIDCISDLHGFYPKLEGGDLLIVAGDLTARDTQKEHQEFYDWFIRQPYTKRVYIPGNHDGFLKKHQDAIFRDEEGLLDFGTEFMGLKIWGSPWAEWFKGINPDCAHFMLDTEEQLAEKWEMIPDDTDILVTHSPPWGIRDLSMNFWTHSSENCGSKTLLDRVMKIKPKLHVFGHIHEAQGEFKADTHFINASIMNERYQPVNKPIRVIL